MLIDARRLSVVLLATGALACTRTASPCANKGGCASQGACKTSLRNTGDSLYRCYVGAEADCLASAACRDDGRCHFEPSVSTSSCVALGPGDCLSSVGCRTRGACTLEPDGTCAPSPAGCTRSAECENGGACHWHPPDEVRCVSGHVDEALWCAEACQAEGACTRDGRSCKATRVEDCAASKACAKDGRCSLDAASAGCVASTPGDCQGAQRCREDDACRLAPRGAFCLDAREPCAREWRCRSIGWCADDQGVCRATSEASCEASMACAIAGRCGLRSGGGECLPRNAGDCERSTECKLFGRCALGVTKLFGSEWRMCVEPGAKPSGNPTLCVASDGCRQAGKCLRTSGDRCEAEAAPTARPGDADAGESPEVPAQEPAELVRAPDEPAPPEHSLVAEIDGKPVALRHAVAATLGGQAVAILLADRPVTCAEVEEPRRWSSHPPGRASVFMKVAPVLLERVEVRSSPPREVWRRPKTPRWRPTWVSWPGGVARGQRGTVVPGEGLARAGTKATVRLAIDARFDVREPHSLKLSGALQVLGCGDHPRAGRELPQVGLDATLDGVPLVFRGATLHLDPADPAGWRLTLSEAPALCRRPVGDSWVDIGLLKSAGGKPTPRPVEVSFDGDRLGVQVAMQSLSLKVPEPGPPVGETAIVPLDLDTTDDPRAFLSLRLRGHASALVCPPRADPSVNAQQP